MTVKKIVLCVISLNYIVLCFIKFLFKWELFEKKAKTTTFHCWGVKPMYSFDDEYLYCIESSNFFQKKVIVAHLKAKQCVCANKISQK